MLVLVTVDVVVFLWVWWKEGRKEGGGRVVWLLNYSRWLFGEGWWLDWCSKGGDGVVVSSALSHLTLVSIGPVPCIGLYGTAMTVTAPTSNLCLLRISDTYHPECNEQALQLACLQHRHVSNTQQMQLVCRGVSRSGGNEKLAEFVLLNRFLDRSRQTLQIHPPGFWFHLLEHHHPPTLSITSSTSSHCS